ncbi:MAG: hypothetical protein HC854_15565 [Flavobacterium sp.]|nr:hypothetical protein [Flavobacterium sp.]
MKPTLSILLILLLILTVTSSYAQTKSCDTIYKNPEVKAQFNKGDKELDNYLMDHIIPILHRSMERDEGIISSLFMYLTINSKGDVIDVTFSRARLSEKCTEELKKNF